MSGKYSKIEWQETMNGVTIDCSLDIAIHPADSKVVLLTVPGVDGSVDGFEDKYLKIAENIQEKYGAATVRMANPFITSYHWESNIRQSLNYILENTEEITGHKDIEIRIMAHSAGAAVVAQIAWEYPEITRMLLVNPATKLGIDKIKYGLSEFSGDRITVLFGSEDPSVGDVDEVAKLSEAKNVHTHILKGVDHNFSGQSLKAFITAPALHLFD